MEQAIKMNDFDRLKRLYQSGIRDKNALWHSVLHGRYNMARYLVNYGMKDNHVLKFVVRQSDFEMTKFFVENGMKDDEALVEAVCIGNKKITKYLLENGMKKNSALWYAFIEFRDLEMVCILIEHGIWVEYLGERIYKEIISLF